MMNCAAIKAEKQHISSQPNTRKGRDLSAFNYFNHQIWGVFIKIKSPARFVFWSWCGHLRLFSSLIAQMFNHIWKKTEIKSRKLGSGYTERAKWSRKENPNFGGNLKFRIPEWAPLVTCVGLFGVAMGIYQGA